MAGGPLLILSARPGDECLGTASLIAAAVRGGHPPFVLVITDGTASHPNSRSHPAGTLRRLREREARRGLAVLGLSATQIGFLGLPDGGIPLAGAAFDAVVTSIASLAIRSNVSCILSSWPFDADPDHDAVHAMGAAAAREAGVRHVSYVVNRPGEPPLPCPAPAYASMVDPDDLIRKRAALAEHRSQYGNVIIDDPSARPWQNPADAALAAEILLDPAAC